LCNFDFKIKKSIKNKKYLLFVIMGCSASQNEVGKDQLLTQQEKDLLNRSWSAVRNRDELGKQV